MDRHQAQVLQEGLRTFRIVDQRLRRQFDAQPAVDGGIALIGRTQQADQVAGEARFGQRQRTEAEDHHAVLGQGVGLRVQRVQDLREQHPVQHAGSTLLGCGLQQAVGQLQLPVAGQQARQYRQ